MSAPAINPAPPPAPSPAAASSVGGASGGQAAPPTGFDAVLATLYGPEDGSAESAAAKTTGKPGAKATADDGKTKAKASADDKTKTADAGAATVPDANANLILVPAAVLPAVAIQPTTPDAAAAALQAQAAVTGVADKSAGQTAANTLAQLAGAAVGGTGPDAAKTQAAAAVATAATNAAATATADAKAGSAQAASTLAKADVATAPQQQTSAPVAPAPVAPVAAPPAPSVVAAAAVPAVPLTPAPITEAKAADPVAPVGGKDKAPVAKSADRVDVIKNAATPGGTAALTAKAADALQPVSGEAPKGGPDDRDQPEAPALDAKTDVTGAPQTPADPATSATTTPAALIHAAAVAVRGAPQTVANLAAQIVKKLDGRSSQFDVQLDPAGLGKVDVRIAIGADGRMSAAMSFDTPQAAAELKARAGELHQAMEQAGFDLSGGMSFDLASDRGQGGQAQNQQPDGGAAFRGRAFQAALDTTVDAVTAPQLTLRRTALAGVDIRI